jgi:rod shape-determining protein MreC
VVVYQQDRRRRVTLVLLILTSQVLISLDERGSGIINSARTAAQDVVSPVQNLADDVFAPATDFFDSLGRADELESENEKLRSDLAQARTQVAAGAVATARAKELEQLLDLPQVEDADGVVADVIAQETGNFSRTFRIDKGANAGIGLNMPVVVGGALVGRVASVAQSSTIVQRIDDRTFGAGAQLVDNGAMGPKGLASGQDSSQFLKFAVVEGAAGTAMAKGAVAITLGGLGDLYPKGLPIGTVVHAVAAGGSVARDAELRPIVDLDSIDVVKVIKYKPPVLP